MPGGLTEVGSVSVEHGQSNKLLHDLRPTGDNGSNQIATLENGPGILLGMLLCENSLLRNGRSHNFLEDVSRGTLNNLCSRNVTYNLLLDVISVDISVAESEHLGCLVELAFAHEPPWGLWEKHKNNGNRTNHRPLAPR